MRRVAVVLALLVMGCSSGTTEPAADPTQPVEPATATAPTDPAEPATTAGATDVTVPTDTVASPKGPFRWERVDPADETIPGGMAAVVAGGPGLVAVGVDGSGGDYDAAVWTSSDGYVWERVAHDEAVFGGAEDQIVRGLAVAALAARRLTRPAGGHVRVIGQDNGELAIALQLACQAVGRK